MRTPSLPTSFPAPQCSRSTRRSQYVTNVINNGTSDYADAYMEINYVKVYSSQNETFVASLSGTSTVLMSATASATPTASGSGSSATGTGSTGSSGSSGSDGSSGSSGESGVTARVYLAFAAGTVLSAFTWLLI